MPKLNLEQQAEDIRSRVLPVHVAVIMDGNGRWASRRFLPRIEGHRAGTKSVERVLDSAAGLGIKYLTLYTFSIENWKRPPGEVAELMRMLKQYLLKEKKTMIKRAIRLRVCGDRSLLSEEIRTIIAETEMATAGGCALNLILALSYGSRQEIARAAKTMAALVRQGEMKPEEITEAVFERHLYTAGIPKVDLLVRTSGECRLSNFLLWQAEGAYLHITKVLWPDFRKAHFYQAVRAYQKAVAAGHVRREGHIR